MTTATIDANVMQEGWAILVERLGLQKATQFVVMLERGKGDSVTEEYLKALSVAPGQPFVPPLAEGLPWDDAWTTLQENESAKAGPLLDDLAKQIQTATDQAWKDWDQLGK